MWIRLGRYNTLRNQILLVFITVMTIVLCFVGIMTYFIVSKILQDNAEKQIQQTAVEANGRMESLHQQIDLLTRQVATNSMIQQLLQDESQDKLATFQQRQALVRLSNEYLTYTNGINNLEIYSADNRKLIPLDGEALHKRINQSWISRADRAEGKLVWIGQDPKEPYYYLAIRRVSLIDRWFSNGGYIVLQINPNYFEFTETRLNNEYMILVDQNNKQITSNYNGDISPIIGEKEKTISLNGNDYMLIKQTSSITGWTLYILTPVDEVMSGITVLRAAILLSGVFGFLIFAFFAVLLSTMITKPIFRLTKTMKKASEGELTLNPDISSTIEINRLNESYNQLVENTNQLIRVVYEKEILKSHAELKALQSQINPHFLFNTLDAMYWSLDEKGEDELAETVLAMSELFRYTISNYNQDEWVTIRQEVEHVELYMQLMKMRFGERFTWTVSIPAELESVPIPKLLIQPIVENAILHGVGNKVGQGFVNVIVELSSNQGFVMISIVDTGPGMETEKINKIKSLLDTGKVSSLKGNGMALGNVNKRLNLYYRQHELNGINISSKVNEGTCVSFEIPINRSVLYAEKNDFNRG
ncbi:sensor histidine kinase [Metabacillus schmidteae]|uniref:sensor histidine kinase n=1 Tax=Metabacillus schmidteae TaxID=2730405 RepID=UPI001588FF1F|nr:sensor histidine kinase [Metabacillus schmidteae]